MIDLNACAIEGLMINGTVSQWFLRASSQEDGQMEVYPP
jgi:hypothetical protein